jgi:outer membrane protein assembly factor BamB
MRNAALLIALTIAATAGRVSSVNAENWPSWRGPWNNGISTETNLPTSWSAKENVAWRTELPGPAGATPVVWDDSIFVTSVSGNDLILQCIGADGKQKWRQTVSQGNRNARGDEGNSAAPSPSTDGKHVWVMFGNGTLACFTVGGESVWKIDLQERYGKFRIAFGMTSTPVLDGDRLYLQLIHGEGNASTREAIVAAVDARTGAALWKHDRMSDAVAECEHSYASPMLYDFGGKKFLLSHGADFVIAHDVDSGNEIWRCGNLNVKSKYDRTLRFVASPACADGIVVVPSAKRGPCVALRPDGRGDISNSAESHLWTREKTPDVPSPLILDDLVYLCMQDGNLYCLDRKTGEEYYFERTHRQRHRASPVYAGGHIYLTARDGVISVVKVGKEFELVAQNEMGESIAASPVISNGTIYLRSFDALWAIRE